MVGVLLFHNIIPLTSPFHIIYHAGLSRYYHAGEGGFRGGSMGKRVPGYGMWDCRLWLRNETQQKENQDAD